MGGKKPLRRPLWPPTRATASNYYPLGLDGAGGAAKPLLRAPKKPAPLHGRLPAFSGAVDAFERARKCFLEWRYFFSIILSEFLKNRVALQELQECFKNLLLLYRAAEEKKNPGQELVSRIDEIMGEHLSDLQFSLDDVAAELYISPNYLRQLFKQASGQTFTEHLTEMRMKEAQRLLDDESLKIYEVAERTGYADSRYFSVCYKKYWHITPTDYRRTLQESG